MIFCWPQGVRMILFPTSFLLKTEFSTNRRCNRWITCTWPWTRRSILPYLFSYNNLSNYARDHLRRRDGSWKTYICGYFYIGIPNWDSLAAPWIAAVVSHFTQVSHICSFATRNQPDTTKMGAIQRRHEVPSKGSAECPNHDIEVVHKQKWKNEGTTWSRPSRQRLVHYRQSQHDTIL